MSRDRTANCTCFERLPRISAASGLVTEVLTLQTTHDTRLDAAAVEAFPQWRFRPHTLRKLTVPADFNIRYG